jgi:hypothetical protein
MFCFHVPTFLQVKVSYEDTRLWLCIRVVLYTYREVKCCGLPLCAFYKFARAAAEEMSRSTFIDVTMMIFWAPERIIREPNIVLEMVKL